MNKKEILESISNEWIREYGQLHNADEDQKDKYYFMIGFVATAIDNHKKEEQIIK